MQQDAGLFGIILTPRVGQRIPCTGHGHGGKQSPLNPALMEDVREGAMIIPGRLEANEGWGLQTLEPLAEEFKVTPAMGHPPVLPPSIGSLDQHVVHLLGQIDRNECPLRVGIRGA